VSARFSRASLLTPASQKQKVNHLRTLKHWFSKIYFHVYQMSTNLIPQPIGAQ